MQNRIAPGSRRNSRSKKGFTLIELIVVISIMGAFLLFAVPNHLEQMDRARVATIQNEVMRVESILEETNALTPERFYRWGNGAHAMLEAYQARDMLYDRDGYTDTLSDLNTKYVPRETVQQEMFSELDGHFFVNLDGTVYYVDDPDAEVPGPLTPDSEIVPGEGWTYADFYYDQDTLLGFSPSGEVKYANGLTSFVMPDINPYAFLPIRKIAYRAFRRTEFEGDFEAPGVEEIADEAFRFSRFEGDFNAPMLTAVDTNTFRESQFNGRFLAPNIRTIAPDAFRESIFKGDFYAPKVMTIGGGAFQLSQFDGAFYAPNVTYMGTHAFLNSRFTNGKFGGSQ